MLCSSKDLDHYVNKKKTSLFNHEIAYLIPNSPFAQYQYFFSSISYPFITSFRLCQFAKCQYQLFPSLTFLLICTIPIPSPSFLSQNIFLFSLTFLLLSYNAYLYLFTFTFTTFLFWVIGFPSYLSLSPSFEGDNFFSSCFHIFFFTVNNLQYDRPHNFII